MLLIFFQLLFGYARKANILLPLFICFLGGSKSAQLLKKVLFYKKWPLPKAPRVWYISGILYRFSSL